MVDGRRILASLATTALVLAACHGGSNVPASPTPSASSGPAPSIVVVSEAPVLEASDLGDGHYGAILPAAYFEADGLRHAYLVGFGDARGDQEVFHATSSDGLTWEIDENPPFDALGLELSPPGPIPGSVVQADDGTWNMYLWGVPAPQSEGAVIYRATASSPAGPWMADPQPVVGLGDAGAWDDLAIDFPAVQPMGTGWLMLYGGIDGTQTTRIGVATSDDGITWQKDPEPVLQADSCGKPGARYAALPRLLPHDAGYVVLFEQDREAAMATSADAHMWTCSGPEPLLVAEDVPQGQGIHTMAATTVGGEVSVLIESLIDGGSEVWLGELRLPD
ncbi:MAG TPA: hypothetical protein VFY43_05665 [Candidatus Limnocylindria bacterium]|nr:hypothetical protein [Candidatus Limnocylindria bacterium]